ncbi:MAG: YtxH domain-containing protein [Salinibacterium sp.]|nr:YtxH domain-containing protein [Salinibacterium sp.]
MKGKILLVVGLGIGYVLGTRAGRERYDEIKAAASKLWNDPRVQKSVDQAGDFVSDSAKKVVSQVTGSNPAERRPTASRKPEARKPEARKSGASTPSTTK